MNPTFYYNDDEDVWMRSVDGKTRRWCRDCDHAMKECVCETIKASENTTDYKNETIMIERTFVYELDYETFGDYFDADTPDEVKLNLWKKIIDTRGNTIDRASEETDSEMFVDTVQDAIEDAKDE